MTGSVELFGDEGVEGDPDGPELAAWVEVTREVNAVLLSSTTAPIWYSFPLFKSE